MTHIALCWTCGCREVMKSAGDTTDRGEPHGSCLLPVDKWYMTLHFVKLTKKEVDLMMSWMSRAERSR